MGSRLTRREFLKTSGFAAAVALTGLSASCMTDPPEEAESPAGNAVLPSDRGEYRVFSWLQVGALLVKNRLVRSATILRDA